MEYNLLEDEELHRLREENRQLKEWATEMHDFLLDLNQACHQWWELHLESVPALECDEWVARYFEILAMQLNSSSQK